MVEVLELATAAPQPKTCIAVAIVPGTGALGAHLTHALAEMAALPVPAAADRAPVPTCGGVDIEM